MPPPPSLTKNKITFKSLRRALYYPFLRMTYRIAAKKDSILDSEPKANARILKHLLSSHYLFKAAGECSHGTDLSDFLMQINSWIDYFSNISPAEIQNLRDALFTDTDELSRETVDRLLAAHEFVRKHPNALDIGIFFLSQQYHYPLYAAEADRIYTLDCKYQSPYRLPIYDKAHMAACFGIDCLPSEIQRQIQGKDFIDGGGFMGDSALCFTEKEPRKIYVFEPNPHSIPTLQKIVQDHAGRIERCRNKIEIVPLALGKEKGTARLNFSDAVFDSGATTLGASKNQRSGCEVNVISIDEYVQEHSLNVGLIKLDIEGAEYDTILGAKNTICSQRPAMLISIYHTPKDFFEIKPMIESWNLGYRFAIRHMVPDWPLAEYSLLAWCD